MAGEEEEEDWLERKKWEKREKIGVKSSAFHLFFLFFLLGIGFVPTVSRCVRRFSKNKKKAGTCLQPCSMHLLCLVHVGPKHGSPNVMSMLSSYTVTFPWFLLGSKFLAKFDEAKGRHTRKLKGKIPKPNQANTQT